MLSPILLFAVASSIMVDGHSIAIQSDNASHNIYEKKSEWTGNVKLEEGAYTLTARVVRVELNELDEPCKVIAVGEPVDAYGLYQDEVATVSGEVILYDCEQRKVRIARDANVHIPAKAMSFSAENIIYDMIENSIRASGAKQPPRIHLEIGSASD